MKTITKENMKKYPAFPYQHTNDGNPSEACIGMTLGQYACIKLKVPKTGDNELDDLIKESLRNDFAAKAINGLIRPNIKTNINTEYLFSTEAKLSYIIADAMLKARE